MLVGGGLWGSLWRAKWCVCVTGSSPDGERDVGQEVQFFLMHSGGGVQSNERVLRMS